MSIREVKYKLPKELLDCFYEVYSINIVDLILKSFERNRKTSFRINSIKGNYEEISKELRSNRIKFVNHSVVKNAFVLKDGNERQLNKLKCYEEGKIYVQNISSMLPPMFLELEKGQRILDMCAAPGSKTSIIASMIENQGEVLANEKDYIRLERLKYNLNKQGARCVNVINEDGRKLGRAHKEKFHRILLDAPCSGEGTISLSSPQTYRGWSKKNVAKNSSLQKKLIDSAIEALKKDGVLIYSTCTISPEENEDVIEYVLENHKDVCLENVDINMSNVMSGLKSYRDKKYSKEMHKTKRIIPNEYMEGFYIAKLRKTI